MLVRSREYARYLLIIKSRESMLVIYSIVVSRTFVPGIFVSLETKINGH